MGYLWVLIVAAAVGVAVYVVTLRAEPARLQGFGPDAGPGAEDAPSGTEQGAYVPVTGGRPDWQSRLTGVFGLAVAVVLGSAALAVVAVMGYSMLARMLGGD